MKKIWICGILLGAILTGCGTKRRSMARGAEDNRNTSGTNTDRRASGTSEAFVFIEAASPEDYIRIFSDIAMDEMREYSIPASITLAQGLLESGFGKGELTRKTNNHFGIKCHTGWDGEFERHDDDERDECFRKYNHPRHSYRDHSLFLSTRSRYAALFELEPDDYRGWARGLKAAGYATDRKYPQKLIHLIERYGLYHYDEWVLGRPSRREGVAASEAGGHTYQVRAGDTLYGISRKYQMTVDELKALNALEGDSLSIGQVLKVKPDNSRK
ncbi:glucosaminidase domain-containing protein [Robiginitalea sp. M366]|uniref:glucosaminidase domain-containing protein n=1 Tax=Robiginitalea aestuariiviva TaxID=3036903 RepID=UPI00240DCC54|nr:glucosaminidase domain-containing protein [Robiginitalea aestuariiviva]MDG1571973.1 glucosaminidase domain-containing protein [Robiginitalea aestuariiviva]